MAERAKLHLSKLDSFAAWAEGLGYVRETPTGDYVVLRLRGPLGVCQFYTRGGAREHATVPDGAPYALFRRWRRHVRKGGPRG